MIRDNGVYADIQGREVRWYRKHGRYFPARICHAHTGRPYVIGDWSWNRSYPSKPETIEPQMHYALTGEIK